MTSHCLGGKLRLNPESDPSASRLKDKNDDDDPQFVPQIVRHPEFFEHREDFETNTEYYVVRPGLKEIVDEIDDFRHAA